MTASHACRPVWSGFVRKTLSAALVLMARGGLAATYAWTGGAANENWSSAANWQGGVAPSPHETGLTLVFSNNVAVKSITNDIPGLSAGTVKFLGDSYVINGRPSTNALALGGTNSQGYSVQVTGTSNRFAGSCPLRLGSQGLFTIGDDKTLEISSAIGGSGGLAKDGPGTLLFKASQTNSFTGGVFVADGEIDLMSGFNLLGTFFPLTSVPGPLTIGGTNAGTTPVVKLLAHGQIADAADVLVDEDAKLMLNGFDEKVGDVTLRGGTIDARSNALWSGIGTLSLNGNFTALNSSGGKVCVISATLDLGTNLRVFDVEADATLTIYGRISGASTNAGLSKTGTGTLALRAGGSLTNDYPGPTLISEGELMLYDTLLGSAIGGTIVTNAGRLSITSPSVPTIAEAITCYGGTNGTSLSVYAPVNLTGNLTLYRGAVATLGPNAGLTNQLSGLLAGTGTIEMIAGGTAILAGDGHAFTGKLEVAKGTMNIAGDYANCSAQAFLTGRLAGMSHGLTKLGASLYSSLAPGDHGPALVPVHGRFNLEGVSSTLEMDINGPEPGVDYDQLVVEDMHYITSGHLQVNVNYDAVPGERFTLIKHTTNSGAVGFFPALPETSLIETNGQFFQISYHGGEHSNDVVLTCVSAVAPQVGSVVMQWNGVGQFYETHLDATGSPLAVYSVMGSTNLSNPSGWARLGSAVAAGDGQIGFADTLSALHARRFYRLTLP